MPDCPPSNSDCDKPIGSPPVGDPCSPCFASTPADLYELVKNLSAEVCALTTRINNWNQLLNRTRNRLTKVEDTLNNLPDEEALTAAVGCAGLETTSEADAVLACEDGAEMAFVPSGTPEKLVFCGGRVKKVAKGLEFYPLATKQLVLNQANMASNDAAVNLPSYPADVCGDVWAVFESIGQAFPGASASGTNAQVAVNGYILISTGFQGDFVSGQAMAKVTSSTTTFNVTAAGSGVRGVTINLIGYMY